MTTPTPAEAIRAAIDALRHATDEEIVATGLRVAADALLPRPAKGDQSPQATRDRLLALQFLETANTLAGNPPPAASREALAEAREESQDRSQLSDGYHTFAELYEHRHVLMLALMRSESDLCWFSRCHADGGLPFDSPDWFIAGAELTTGPITYHLPARLWETAQKTGAGELPVGMAWDGHTPADVVERLKSWAAWLPASREESQAAAWQGIEPEQVLSAVEALAVAIGPTPAKDPWGHGFDVSRLADRLDELADYVTQGPDSVRRNFTMRVPAEPYHDADLVLSTAAGLPRDGLATPAELPPRPPISGPPDSLRLVRYGVTWQGGRNEPLLAPTDDGYWTPWWVAKAKLAKTEEALRRLVAWGGFRSPSAGYNADVVLGVADWFADGMTGPLPPLPPYIASREGLEPTPSAPALPPAIAYGCGDGVVIEATNRERTSWAVRDDLSCLNSSGEWEPEPYPSSRDADFLARTRWPSAKAAWNALLGFRTAELLANYAAAEGVQS